jgi:hypothetical protein
MVDQHARKCEVNPEDGRPEDGVRVGGKERATKHVVAVALLRGVDPTHDSCAPTANSLSSPILAPIATKLYEVLDTRATLQALLRVADVCLTILQPTALHMYKKKKKKNSTSQLQTVCTPYSSDSNLVPFCAGIKPDNGTRLTCQPKPLACMFGIDYQLKSQSAHQFIY